MPQYNVVRDFLPRKKIQLSKCERESWTAFQKQTFIIRNGRPRCG